MVNTSENDAVESAPSSATLSSHSMDTESGIVDFYTQYNSCPLTVNTLLSLWQFENLPTHKRQFAPWKHQTHILHASFSSASILSSRFLDGNNNSIQFQPNSTHNFHDKIHNAFKKLLLLHVHWSFLLSIRHCFYLVLSRRRHTSEDTHKISNRIFRYIKEKKNTTENNDFNSYHSFGIFFFATVFVLTEETKGLLIRKMNWFWLDVLRLGSTFLMMMIDLK